MLHIILGILKIIGIIFGILLLLVILAVLSLLFVPLRYQAEVEKKDSLLRVGAKISWFLRAVSFSISYTLGGGLDMGIRLFGFTLPFLRRKSGGRNGEISSDHLVTDNQESDQEKHTEEFQKNDQQKHSEEFQKSDQEKHTEEFQEDSQEKHTEDFLESDLEEQTEELRKNSEEDSFVNIHEDSCGDPLKENREKIINGRIKEDPEKFIGIPEAGKDQDLRNNQESAENRKSKGRLRERIRSLSFRVTGILSRISWFIEKIFQIPLMLGNLIEKIVFLPDTVRETIGGFLNKPEEFWKLIQKMEGRELAGDLFGYFLFLLEHYKPRRISGWIHFGTGDPALSAQLTGFLYLILPGKASGFSIDTEFYEKVFETDFICSGRIRTCHVIRVAWRGFRNKRLRRAIRLYRRRGRDSERRT